MLPLDRLPFEASVRVTALGQGVSARGVKTQTAVAIRSEFKDSEGIQPTITYVLPSLNAGKMLFDGREVDGRSLVTRIAGHTPSMRTFGPNEAGAFTITQDVLRQAAESLTGQSHKDLLLAPATIFKTAPEVVTRLRTLHRSAGDILKHYSSQELNGLKLPALAVLRDQLFAMLIDGVTGHLSKPDHRARQLQTRSMARIERYLDDHRESVIDLQELCLGTGLPLRTVETIIRSRTGMPALVYLRRRRLAFVRHMLLHPDEGTTVTSVAIHFGFWHLSRFSRYYQEVYDELPSQTLARVLARSVSRASRY